ncbi:MAG: hypothetical protein PVF59_09220 [Desulfobacterales bacterium]|jgi:hypothetical protein
MKTIGLWALVPCLLAIGCASHYIRPNNGNTDLYLRCEGVHEVALATSLDGFTPHPARPAGADLWVVSVKAKRDFRYFYLVDGKILIPECRMIEQDDFGGTNCIYSALP